MGKTDKKEEAGESAAEKKDESEYLARARAAEIRLAELKAEEQAAKLEKKAEKDAKKRQKALALEGQRAALVSSLFGSAQSNSLLSNINCPTRPEEGLAKMEEDERRARNLAGF